MRITVNALAFLRANAVAAVNAHCNAIAAGQAHRDVVHREKRLAAERVIAGGDANPMLRQEAELRGITARQLAELIVAKPDALTEREIARQRLLVAVETASTRDQIERELASASIRFISDRT